MGTPLEEGADRRRPRTRTGRAGLSWDMQTLLRYLKPYWRFVLLALFLAAINQIFSLLDPLIFRHVIDRYATQYDKYNRQQFFRGVALLLAMAVGVAFVSRVA